MYTFLGYVNSSGVCDTSRPGSIGNHIPVASDPSIVGGGGGRHYYDGESKGPLKQRTSDCLVLSNQFSASNCGSKAQRFDQDQLFHHFLVSIFGSEAQGCDLNHIWILEAHSEDVISTEGCCFILSQTSHI